ncbi:hypothetical protein WMF26_35775 [Sorangium sp. So ce185]|uniref:hypothetical protein n=1 Tax=Sorangium sp. So ce185 TaxID=3133287 RepID=UPI003F5E5B8E
MAKQVVFLITDPACAQSRGIANAILGAFDIEVSGYCYQNGHVYRYTRQNGLADAGAHKLRVRAVGASIVSQARSRA